MKALSSRVHDALTEAGRRAEIDLTAHARNSAHQAGWPEEAASTLRASLDGGRIKVHFNDDLAGDWEYGTEDRPPLPVARFYENRHDNYVSRVYEGHLDRVMRGIL